MVRPMLEDRLKDAAQAKNFAMVSTKLANGHIHSSIMWLHADDEFLYVNTETARQKFKNIEADPHINVSIWLTGDRPTSIEVRGTVVASITGDEAWEHINELSHKYIGIDYPNPVLSERVKIRIAPEKVIYPPG